MSTLDLDQPDQQAAAIVCKFSEGDAATLLQNLQTARAIVRAVALAVCAQEDGAILYDDGNRIERWGPALSEACIRLREVREALISKASAPAVDWFTPLALGEALDAALWHGYSSRTEVERLDAPEFVSAAQAFIDSLDALGQDFEEAGVHRLAGLSGRSAAH